MSKVKAVITGLVATAAAILLVTAVAFAGHDNGNGNSQDGGNGGNGGNASQEQSQGQTAVGVGVGISEGSHSNSGGNTQGVSINHPRQHRIAPGASAPALAVAPETCMGSTSAGVSTPFGGIIAAGSWKSEGCERRMNARSLSGLGYPVAALYLLALDPDVRTALIQAGVDLPTPPAPVVAEARTDFPPFREFGGSDK